MFLFWLMLSYLSGALPWSVWLGRVFFHLDPREQTDSNPGAANSFRAAGWRLGISVLLLDFLKAFIPVAAVYWLIGFTDGQVFWIALMPTIGHAFSVFLRFRGGRGLVVMFGVWAALTLYRLPLVMGITAICAMFLFKKDDYRTLSIPLVLIVYLFLTHAATWMIVLAVAQLMILVVKIGAFYLHPPTQKRI